MIKQKMKTVAAGLLLLATAFANRAWGQVVVLHPHETIASRQDTAGAVKVFLAGTIDMGNSTDWQTQLGKRFEALGGKWLLFNPRQQHWDASKAGEMDYQVNWELEHLEAADLIIMNIAEKSKSPVSLLELGLLHDRARCMSSARAVSTGMTMSALRVHDTAFRCTTR